MSRSSLLAAALFMACAADPGTRPEAASAAEHEAMAAREERAAAAQAATGKGSALQPASAAPCQPGSVCWSSSTSPTEQDLEEARLHRELAAKHRAASATLVAAEQQACAGLPAGDRDISPFRHRADIASVSVLEEPTPTGKQPLMKATGARIEFRAVPGMSAELLQRLVDCHLARAAVMGHEMPGMDYCPLELEGVKASVSSTGTGFAVSVTADDAATAREIIRRAQALRQ